MNIHLVAWLNTVIKSLKKKKFSIYTIILFVSKDNLNPFFKKNKRIKINCRVKEYRNKMVSFKTVYDSIQIKLTMSRILS